MTICTTDTIGTIRSQRLFRVLFDSGSNTSKIKRSALPKGIITKLLNDTKLVRTLAGCLKTQEVVTIQDLRLPKINKNRRINQQNVFSVWQWQRLIQHHPGYKLSFQDSNTVELLRRKHGMVWLLHPTLSTWMFGLEQSWCHGRHVSHPSWKRALWWRLAWMLCSRDSGCQVWKDKCSWGCERTHSSKHTSKSRFALSATGKQQDVWWNPWCLSTQKGTHGHWSKCQACAF